MMVTMNADEWCLTKLRKITTKIGSGATPRGGKKSYKKDGITLIRSLNVYDFNFKYDGLAFIDEDQAEKLSNVEIHSNDILLNITGASVARCCMVPAKLLPARVNQHVAIVRVNPTIADSGFILYCINSPQYKHHLLTLAQGGATREALTKDTIGDFEIALPPLTTQRKIAAILSAYDDLIENNTRRIKILEEMAQALYREWFVKFRFPGHEKVKMVESELGMVPEGWEVNKVKETFEILGGGTPSKKVDEYWENGEIVWYTPSDLTSSNTMFMEQSSNQITELGLKKSSAKLFPPYSIMMTSRATLGIVAINTTPACTNQGFITCLTNERVPIYYIYYWLLENTNTFLNMASGATFKEISKTVFKTIDIILPSQNILDDFQRIVEPLVDQVLNIQRKNANLRRTRNLLLPKLISGEVDVENIDVEMPNNGGA